MEREPIIRRRRWQAGPVDGPVSESSPPPPAAKSAPAAPEPAAPMPASPAAAPRRPALLLAVFGMLLGLGATVGVHLFMTRTENGAEATGVNALIGPTTDDSEVEPPKSTVAASEDVAGRADLEILVRLWNLAALTMEEVTGLQRALDAAAGIVGTQSHEAMRVALDAKQRELTSRKLDLAQQLMDVGAAYDAEGADTFRAEVSAFIDGLRSEKKSVSAGWLERSRAWWTETSAPNEDACMGMIDDAFAM